MNIAALISGGVDSAVVVHLLCEQEYKPDLFYIKIGMDGDEDLTCTAEGYIKTIALDKNDEICGYEFVHLGKFMDEIKKGTDANEALKKVTGTYGRFTEEQGAVKHIDPRHE